MSEAQIRGGSQPPRIVSLYTPVVHVGAPEKAVELAGLGYYLVSFITCAMEAESQ